MKLEFDIDKLLNISRDIFFTIHEGPFQFIVFGIGLFALLFFGKLINSWVGGSERGIIGTSIGLLLPFIIGLFIFGLARLNMHQFVRDPELFAVISTSIGIFTSLLTLLLATPIFLGTTMLKSCLVFGLSVAIMLCALYLTKAGVDSYDVGKHNVEKSSFYKREKVSQDINNGSGLKRFYRDTVSENTGKIS